MTRFAGTLAALFVLALVGPACGGGDDLEAFCNASREATQSTSEDKSPEELTEAMENVAENAPDEIKEAADALAEETRAVFAGEKTDLTDMEELETEVATFAQENCES